MATKLFLRNTRPDMGHCHSFAGRSGITDNWGSFNLLTAQGASGTSLNATSVNGPIYGLEWSSGGGWSDWISTPVAADVTISGDITANVWAHQATDANAALNVCIDVIRANEFETDGRNKIDNIVDSTNTTEMAIGSSAVNNFTTGMTSGSYTPVTVNRGDRIRISPVYGDSSSTMVTGVSINLAFDAATGVAGDSYVQFTETIVLESGPVDAAALISSFTGSDENPLSEGGNWANINSALSPMERVSNAVRGVSGISGSYWTPANFGPDLEAYATLDVVATTFGGIQVRIQGEGGANTWDGYRISASQQGGGTIVSRVTDAVSTTIFSVTTTNWLNGDRLGVRCVGNSIQVWRLPVGGTEWQALGSVFDSTYPNAGKVGVWANGTSTRITDFYAATDSDLFITPTGTRFYFTNTHSGLPGVPALISDFTGADENPLSEGGNWANLNSSGNALQRISNAVSGSAVGDCHSYWTPANFGADLEAYATISTVTASLCGITVRIQGEGGANTWDGYRISANSTSTTIERVTNAAISTLHTAITAWASGDALGVRCNGSTIQAWRKASGSSTWNLVMSAVDTLYASAGKVGVWGNGTSSQITDFYAATDSNFFTQKATTARGAGAVSTGIRVESGPKNPQLVIEWYTAPLVAFTLGGMTVANLRALEGSSGVNSSLRCEVARVEGDGSDPTVWASWCISQGVSGRNGELNTTESAETAYVSGDDLQISNGQRLRIRLYAVDANLANSALGAATFFYNGTPGGGTGDSYIILPQVVEELAGYHRLYGPAELSTTPTELFRAGARTTIRHVYINNPAAETVKPTLSIGADAASTRFMDLQDIEAGEAWDTRRRTEHTLEAGETVQGWYEGYSSVVLADSPIAYYRMNEASGLPQDSSGNGNHMTSSLGTPVYSQAGPLSGDSTDGGIRFKEADTDHFAGPDIDVGDVFTIEAWIKRNDFATDEYVAVSMGSQEAGLYVHANFAKLAKTSVDFVASSLLTIDNDGFYDHVVVTKDGSTRKVYINGADDTNISGFTDQTMTANTEPTSLGVEYAGGSPNGRFEGTLSEVAIYPTALSAARVLAHYQAALASGPPVIVLDGYVEPS